MVQIFKDGVQIESEASCSMQSCGQIKIYCLTGNIRAIETCSQAACMNNSADSDCIDPPVQYFPVNPQPMKNGTTRKFHTIQLYFSVAMAMTTAQGGYLRSLTDVGRGRKTCNHEQCLDGTLHSLPT